MYACHICVSYNIYIYIHTHICIYVYIESLTERLERLLALRLRSVAVDRRGREALVVQELLEHVCLSLGRHEHKHTLALHTLRQQHVHEHAALLAAVTRVQDLLENGIRGSTHAAHRQSDEIALQEILKMSLLTRQTHPYKTHNVEQWEIPIVHANSIPYQKQHGQGWTYREGESVCERGRESTYGRVRARERECVREIEYTGTESERESVCVFERERVHTYLGQPLHLAREGGREEERLPHGVVGHGIGIGATAALHNLADLGPFFL